VQRSFVTAAPDVAVGLRSLLQREILRERHNAVQAWSVLFQPGEVHPRQVRRRHLPRPDEWRQRGNGEECKLVERSGTGRRRLQRHFDLRTRRGATLRFPACGVWTERDCRLRVERDVQLTEAFEVVEILVHATCRLLFFGFSEIDAEDLFRAVERRLVDPGCCLLPRGRRSRQAPRDGRRDRREKPAARHRVARPVLYFAFHPFSRGLSRRYCARAYIGA
jgi:hypothetical protein